MNRLFITVLLASFLLSLISCASKKTSSEIIENKINFNSNKEALDYMLERRLLIQRFYENSSEPYFGKPEEIKCKDNINIAGELKTLQRGSYFFLQVLTDNNFNMGDCLLENNTRKVLYEFFLCDTLVIERKVYTKITSEMPLGAPTFRCN